MLHHWKWRGIFSGWQRYHRRMSNDKKERKVEAIEWLIYRPFLSPFNHHDCVESSVVGWKPWEKFHCLLFVFSLHIIWPALTIQVIWVSFMCSSKYLIFYGMFFCHVVSFIFILWQRRCVDFSCFAAHLRIIEVIRRLISVICEQNEMNSISTRFTNHFFILLLLIIMMVQINFM